MAVTGLTALLDGCIDLMTILLRVGIPCCTFVLPECLLKQKRERPGHGMIIDAQVVTQISPSNQEHTHEVIIALLYTLR
jgi:hypothetical protein